MRAHPRIGTGLATLLALAATPAASAAQEPAERTHGPDPASAAGSARIASVSSASNWCPNTQPGANQVHNGEYRYHAVYVHPADRGSRLSTVGGQLHTSALGASALIERQYSRAIRFDMGTPCGRDQLDISQVRLPYTEAELAGFAAAGGTATFDAVASALRNAGYGVALGGDTRDQLATRRLNFLVWLDGPAPANSCGQGTALLDPTRSDTNVNNVGGKLSLIFSLQRGVLRAELGPPRDRPQPRRAPARRAQHDRRRALQRRVRGHDVPRGAPSSWAATDGVFFDYGNDDYWDPPEGQPLGWWTLNLSRFICPDARCNGTAAASRRRAAQRARHPAGRAGDQRRRDAGHDHDPCRRPRLVKRARRGQKYVRLRVRALGQGTVRVIVSCRRVLHPGGAHPRRVVSRRVALPQTVHVRTRCGSLQVRLADWRRPVASRPFSRSGCLRPRARARGGRAARGTSRSAP